MTTDPKVRKLVEAARSLLAKLELIEPVINRMIVYNYARTREQYDGPNYVDEKNVLRAAIAAVEDGAGEDDRQFDEWWASDYAPSNEGIDSMRGASYKNVRKTLKAWMRVCWSAARDSLSTAYVEAGEETVSETKWRVERISDTGIVMDLNCVDEADSLQTMEECLLWSKTGYARVVRIDTTARIIISKKANPPSTEPAKEKP